MTSPKLKALAAALVAGSLLAGVMPDAQAQANERRAERERKKQEAATAKAAAQPGAETRYPNAKRESPDAGASKDFQPRLEALFAANEAKDAAQVATLGAGITGDAEANAYEKSLAYRVMGVSAAGSDPARAQQLLEQAISTGGFSNNDHFDTMFVVAQLQMQQQQFAPALATVDRALAESGSTDPKDLALKGNALYRLDRHAEAIDVLKPIVDADPDIDPRIPQMLAAAYSGAGRGAEAAALNERMAASTPQDPAAQKRLANAYIDAGDDARAIEIYEKLRAAGELKEENDYRNLFAMYVNSDGDNSAKALAAINDGIDKGVVKPDHKLYSVIGQTYFFAEQTGPAIEAYRKAAATAPDGEASLNLAKILAGEGRAAESKQAAQQALDKGVKEPEDARSLLAR